MNHNFATEQLEKLLAELDLPTLMTKVKATFHGQEPDSGSPLYLSTAMAVTAMATSVIASAIAVEQGAQNEEISIDLASAIHAINPDAYRKINRLWDEPFDVTASIGLHQAFLFHPYHCEDDKYFLPVAVYPHQVLKWCTFLDCSPTISSVAAVLEKSSAVDLEQRAYSIGLPGTMVRNNHEWKNTEQGKIICAEPPISVHKITDEAVGCNYGSVDRPLHNLKVLSFTHAIAGPTIGRTLAEHGARVITMTQLREFEHDVIYYDANIGSRSVLADFRAPEGKELVRKLVTEAHVIVDNHRPGALEKWGITLAELRELSAGKITVSVNAFGAHGPWNDRAGFDMNASAAVGIMYAAQQDVPVLPPTRMLNDFITGYLGATGVLAALYQQLHDGGSWHVAVSLAHTANWCFNLGLKHNFPDHTSIAIKDPNILSALTPLGKIQRLAPLAQHSRRKLYWENPILFPRGSNTPTWDFDANPQ